MSRIYFHSRDDETEVHGSERAYMGGLVNDALLAGLWLNHDFQKDERLLRLMKLVPSSKDQYWNGNPRYFETFLSGTTGSNDAFEFDGKKINFWCCSLNTLLAIGSDPMKLAARLHAQCEIHAFVEGPNREWLADIMEEGRASGIFRANQGWEETIKHLRSRDDEPVVTSYSVCDQFPNPEICSERGTWVLPDKEIYEGEPWDAWYELSAEEQWESGLKAIRDPEYGCELRPDRWEFPEMFFGEAPITAYHVSEAAFAVSG